MAIKIQANVAGCPVATKFLEKINSVMQDAEKVFQGFAEEVGERMIDRTPVDTGRAKGNWQTTINATPNYALIRYDKEGVEVKEELKEVTSKATLEDTINITNCVTYTEGLEFGTSKQAPEGMVRITVAEGEDILNDVIRKVKAQSK